MAVTRNEYLSYIATTLTIHMLFAPKQESFEDIPVLIYDVAGSEYEFKRMIYARDLRMHEIAGFHIGPYSVPVTPVRNPATGRSHHIVRLIHKHDPRYSVDLLFCDCDLYLVAFRRSRVDQGWGQWYKFDDQNVPAFIDSVNLGMYSNHGSRLNATPGGYTSQTDMFYSLATYQDR